LAGLVWDRSRATTPLTQGCDATRLPRVEKDRKANQGNEYPD
jgi:hypothetical protein